MSRFLVRANPSTCTFASFLFLFFPKILTFQCSPVSSVSWPSPLALDMNCYLPSCLIRTILGIPLLYCQGVTLNFFLIFKQSLPIGFLPVLCFPSNGSEPLFFFFFNDLALLTFTFELPLQSPRHRETCGVFLTTQLISKRCCSVSLLGT